MKKFTCTKNEKGQALTEMLLSIPILFLFAAGIIQFAILFLSYVQFQHACGEAARQYAAGMIDKDSLSLKVHESLGTFNRFFVPVTLTVTPQEPTSTVAGALDKVKAVAEKIPLLINYDGTEWAFDVKCKPPLFFGALFPGGVPFHTVLQVYRYPEKP